MIEDIDRLVKEMGRTPKDQDELTKLLGRELPTVHDGEFGDSNVHYQRMNEDHYMLQYELWATDDWIYQSANPQAGWVQHYY